MNFIILFIKLAYNLKCSLAKGGGGYGDEK